MPDPRYTVEPLGPHHDRRAFTCGEEALDRYFKHQAGLDVRRSLAAVFVLVDTHANRAAGFYSLSALSVDVADLPSDEARKLPKLPIPATLLGRLAVDSAHQGQKLGQALLFDALVRAYNGRTQVGAMAVIVDAKHGRARAFYEHYQFRRFPTNEYRLFIPMTTIAQLLEAAHREAL